MLKLSQLIISRAYETTGILKFTGKDLSRRNMYEERANNFYEYDDITF